MRKTVALSIVMLWASVQLVGTEKIFPEWYEIKPVAIKSYNAVTGESVPFVNQTIEG